VKAADIKPRAEKIRAAFAAGKDRVTLDGIEMTIKEKTKERSWESGGVTHHGTEHWLVAQPADGSLVPTYSVERENGGNLRTREMT